MSSGKQRKRPFAEFVLEALAGEGVDHLFLIPGGLVDDFMPAFDKVKGVTPILAASETGAGFMADGYYRASGTFGVCLGIAGPGAVNFVPPLATAKEDQSAVLAIAGEVATELTGQGAFQDASTAGLNDLEAIRPLCRYAIQAESPTTGARYLRTALREMLGAQHSPAYIKIPTQVQKAKTREEYKRLPKQIYAPEVLDSAAATRAWSALAKREKIAILAGRGVEKAGATKALIDFAHAFAIPVATTLRAKGVYPEDDPFSLGVFGYAGIPPAHEVVLAAGLEALIVLGSSLTQRDTLFWSERIHPPGRLLVQVDVDPSAMGRTYFPDHEVIGDAGAALDHWHYNGLAQDLEKHRDAISMRHAWLKSLGTTRFENASSRTSNATPVHPARAIVELRDAADAICPDAVLLVDSGAHRAFAGHHWTSYGPRQYLSATGLAPMGWAIAAAVGAQLARPNLRCIVVTGDGCMKMQGMELKTAARYKANITYVVMNNSALGNVKLRAEKVGGEAPIELTTLENQNWADFGAALGLMALRVTKPADLSDIFSQALACEGPSLVEIVCSNAKTPVTKYSKSKVEYLDVTG